MASATNNLTLILGVADAQLQAGIRRAQRAIRGLGRESEVTEKRTSRAMTRMAVKTQASMGAARKSVARFSEAVRTSVVNLRYLATFFAGGALMVGVVKFSSTFERSLANVNTLLDGSGVKIERYKQQLLDLSTRSSKDLMDLSKALYQIVSAGIPAIEGLGGAYEFLERAQAAAVAGLADTEEAANAMLSFVQAYSQQGLTAARAADILQRTVELGRTTWSQLAHAIGRVTPLAAQFGMTAEEVGASLVVLTRAGVNTNEAVTGMRAIINNLAKPTKKGKEVLSELGLEFDSASIKSKGFAGVLSELYEKTGGNIEIMGRLFPNIRALLPVVVQAGQDFHLFNETLEEMEGSSGAVDEAVSKIETTFSHTFAVLKSNFQKFLVDLGSGNDGVLERVRDFFESLSDSLVYGTEFLGMNVKEGIKSFLSSLVSLVDFMMGPLKNALEVLIVAVGVKLVAALGMAIHRSYAFMASGISGGMAAMAASAAGAAQMAQGLAASQALGVGLSGGFTGQGFLKRGVLAGKSFLDGLVMAGAGPAAQARAAAAGTVTAQSLMTATTSVVGGASPARRLAFGIRGFFMMAMRAVPFLAIASMFIGPVIDWIKNLFTDAEPEVSDAAKQMYDGIKKQFDDESERIEIGLKIEGGAQTDKLRKALKKLSDLEKEFADKKDKLGEEALRKYRRRLQERVKAAREAFNEEKGLTPEGAQEKKKQIDSGKKFEITGAQKDVLAQQFESVGTEAFTIARLVERETAALQRIARANGKELDVLVAKEKAIGNVRRAVLGDTSKLGKYEERLNRFRFDVAARRLSGESVDPMTGTKKGGVRWSGDRASFFSRDTGPGFRPEGFSGPIVRAPQGAGLDFLAEQAYEQEFRSPGTVQLDTEEERTVQVKVIDKKTGEPVVDDEGNIVYETVVKPQQAQLTMDERLLGPTIGRDTEYSRRNRSKYDPSERTLSRFDKSGDDRRVQFTGGGHEAGLFRDHEGVGMFIPNTEKIISKLVRLAEAEAKERGLDAEATKALVQEKTSDAAIAAAIEIAKMDAVTKSHVFDKPDRHAGMFRDPSDVQSAAAVAHAAPHVGTKTSIEEDRGLVTRITETERAFGALRMEAENTAAMLAARVEIALKDAILKGMGVEGGLAAATKEQVAKMNAQFKDLRILPTPSRQRRSYADIAKFVLMVNGKQQKISDFMLRNNSKLTAAGRTTVANLITSEQQYASVIAKGQTAADKKRLLSNEEISQLAEARGLQGKARALFEDDLRNLRRRIHGFALLGRLRRDDYAVQLKQADAARRQLNAQDTSLKHDKKGAALRNKDDSARRKIESAINSLIRMRKKFVREIKDMEAAAALERAKNEIASAKRQEDQAKKRQERLRSLLNMEGSGAVKNANLVARGYKARLSALKKTAAAERNLADAEIEDAKRKEATARERESDKIKELAKWARRTKRGQKELARTQAMHRKRREAGEKKLAQKIEGINQKLFRTLQDIGDKRFDIERERLELLSSAEDRAADNERKRYEKRLEDLERFAQKAKKKIGEVTDVFKAESLGAGLGRGTAEAFFSAYTRLADVATSKYKTQVKELETRTESIRKAVDAAARPVTGIAEIVAQDRFKSGHGPFSSMFTPSASSMFTPSAHSIPHPMDHRTQELVSGMQVQFPKGETSETLQKQLADYREVLRKFREGLRDAADPTQFIKDNRGTLAKQREVLQSLVERGYGALADKIDEVVGDRKTSHFERQMQRTKKFSRILHTALEAELARIKSLGRQSGFAWEAVAPTDGVEADFDKLRQNIESTNDTIKRLVGTSNGLKGVAKLLTDYAASAREATEGIDPEIQLQIDIGRSPELKAIVDLMKKGTDDTRLFLEAIGAIPSRLQKIGVGSRDIAAGIENASYAAEGFVDWLSSAGKLLVTAGSLGQALWNDEFRQNTKGFTDFFLAPIRGVDKFTEKARGTFLDFDMSERWGEGQKVPEAGKGNIASEAVEASIRTVFGALQLAVLPLGEAITTGVASALDVEDIGVGTYTKNAMTDFLSLVTLPFKKFGEEQKLVLKAVGMNLIADSIEGAIAFVDITKQGMANAMTGSFDALTTRLVGAAAGFGDKLASYTSSIVGSFFKGNKLLQGAFTKTIGPLMKVPGMILQQVNKVLLAPAMGAIKGSFDTLFQGISNAFGALTDPSRLDSSLRARYKDIRKESNQIIANLQQQAKTTKDVGEYQKIQGQIAEEQAKRRKALREEKKRQEEGSPEKIIEKAISQAVEMIDKIAEKLPGLVELAINALIENLPTLIDKAVTALVSVVEVLAEKLPELMVVIIQALLDALPRLMDALGTLIPALFDALLQGLVLILRNLGPILESVLDGLIKAIKGILISIIRQLPGLLDAVIGAIPTVITAIVEAIPVLVEAIAEALPELVVALIAAVPAIIAALIRSLPRLVWALITLLPKIIIALVKGIGTGIKNVVENGFKPITDAWKWIIEALYAVGDFFSSIADEFTADTPTGVALRIGGGAALGAAIGSYIAPGVGTAIGAGAGALVGGIASLFHDGGMVGPAQRGGRRLAAALSAAGAPAFNTGGMVKRSVGDAIRRKMMGIPSSLVDDVPAVLQSGESVLNRRATAALGAAGVSALNNGAGIESGPTNITVSLNASGAGINQAAAALLPHLIQGVTVEAKRPGSGLRNEIKGSGRTMPVGSRGTSRSQKPKS